MPMSQKSIIPGQPAVVQDSIILDEVNSPEHHSQFLDQVYTSTAEIKKTTKNGNEIMYCYAVIGRCTSPSYLWLTGCKGEMETQLRRLLGFDKWVSGYIGTEERDNREESKRAGDPICKVAYTKLLEDVKFPGEERKIAGPPLEGFCLILQEQKHTLLIWAIFLYWLFKASNRTYGGYSSDHLVCRCRQRFSAFFKHSGSDQCTGLDLPFPIIRSRFKH